MESQAAEQAAGGLYLAKGTGELLACLLLASF